MPWSVHVVRKMWQSYPHILPPGEFTLVDEKKNKKKTRGWLPCHHGNVSYELIFKKNGDIARVVCIKMNKGKKRGPVTAAAKAIEKKKIADMGYTKEMYLVQAEHAYRDQATWTVSVLYSPWRIYRMDIRNVFHELVTDPENICRRNNPACIDSVMYNPHKALVCVKNVLKTLDEPPFDDLEGFEARMVWQKLTKFSTGALEEPCTHIKNVQKYQNIWTIQQEIDDAKKINAALTPLNCNLLLGTPCNQEGSVVCATLEEAFTLKCYIECDIFMLNPPFTEKTREQMGLPNIHKLQEGGHVCIPFAHQWGVQDWLDLIAFNPVAYTCIGRLDQYAKGRGHVFRQMTEASFPTTVMHHFKILNVEMVSTTNVQKCIQQIQEKYKVVQCFSETPEEWTDIDTGRRQLTNPYRIRTLTSRKKINFPQIALVEEKSTINVGKNVSVVAPWLFASIPVDVGIYICSDLTKSFDIHAVRTHVRHKLFIINCQTNLFTWEHKAPSRIAVNPFI